MNGCRCRASCVADHGCGARGVPEGGIGSAGETVLGKRSIFEMTNGEATKVRAWIVAFRERRIDAEGLKRRLLGSGYIERDVRRLTELLAAASNGG